MACRQSATVCHHRTGVGMIIIYFPYYRCGEVGIGRVFSLSTFVSIVFVTCIYYNDIVCSRVSYVDGEKPVAYTIFTVCPVQKVGTCPIIL